MNPDAVTSLLLHAGWVTTGPREAFTFELWARLLRADPALLARHLILTAMGPGLLGALNREQLAELAAGFTAMLDERILPQIELDGRIDLRDSVGRVLVPTLVLASAEDQILPPHHQRELARRDQRRPVSGGPGRARATLRGPGPVLLDHHQVRRRPADRPASRGVGMNLPARPRSLLERLGETFPDVAYRSVHCALNLCYPSGHVIGGWRW